MSPSLTFPIALTAEAHDTAQQASDGQPSGPRAKQAYLNALARFAVAQYLHCMGLETQASPANPEAPPLAPSPATTRRSADRAMEALSESTTLDVADLGQLECCAVLPGKQHMTVPIEAIWDRIGYVAVQLENSLRTAKIIGFCPYLDSADGTLRLDELSSLEALLDHLYRLSQPEEQRIPINLTHWFHNAFEQGWQVCHDLLRTPSLEPAIAFRSPRVTARKAIALDGSPQKIIDLLITLVQKPDHRTQIELQLVSPDATDLPQGLSLSILDEQGQTFLEKDINHPTPALIIQPFKSSAGEQFILVVRLGELEFREHFIA